MLRCFAIMMFWKRKLIPITSYDFLKTLRFSEGFDLFVIEQKDSIVFQTTEGETLKTQVKVEYLPEIKVSSYSNSVIINDEIENQFQYLKLIQSKIVEYHQHVIETGKSLLKREPLISPNIESETKGLEWLRVSTLVLLKSLEHIKSREDLIYTGSLYFGKRLESLPFEMRLKSLSLDFLFIFLDDGRLRVACWDYKDQIPQSEQEPNFQSDFSVMKNQVFDLFIPVLVENSKLSTQL